MIHLVAERECCPNWDLGKFDTIEAAADFACNRIPDVWPEGYDAVAIDEEGVKFLIETDELFYRIE